MKKYKENQELTPANVLLEKFEKIHLLVVGDVMLDRFITGTVERISPESPVPVLSVRHENQMLGGAGNTVANLAGLGVKATLLSLVGEDTQASQIRNQLEQLNLPTQGLVCDPARPTTVKTRYLAGHQQLLRTDAEDKTPVRDAVMAELLQKAETHIGDCDALILSDYGKGLLKQALISALIELAKARNIPVIIDPKGHDFSIYRGADAITPNKKELHEATNMPVGTDEEVIAAAHHLIDTCGIEAVVATRSGEGMSLIKTNEEPIHLRGADIEVFDVSGAGDAVIATIGAVLGTGERLEEAARLANLAGRVVVTKVGTAPIRLDELQNAILEDEGTRAREWTQAPLTTWDEAEETIKRWRARGLKIGFTNGCFDIIHRGHVSYLFEARKRCDRLIVALNRDFSVQQLKGPDRPVHDEEARGTVLRALSAVDMVVLFGAEEDGADNTAIPLLERLQPDLYLKGGDYTDLSDIPEAPTVQNYGGKIELMPAWAGHSTTGSVEKIRARS